MSKTPTLHIKYWVFFLVGIYDWTKYIYRSDVVTFLVNHHRFAKKLLCPLSKASLRFVGRGLFLQKHQGLQKTVLNVHHNYKLHHMNRTVTQTLITTYQSIKLNKQVFSQFSNGINVYPLFTI